VNGAFVWYGNESVGLVASKVKRHGRCEDDHLLFTNEWQACKMSRVAFVRKLRSAMTDLRRLPELVLCSFFRTIPIYVA